MRRVVVEKLQLDDLYVHKNVRSDLADQMQKYWCGKENSNIGLQYLTFKDGIVRVHRGAWERMDIFLVQVPDVTNVFVEPFSPAVIQPFDGVELDSAEMQKIRAKVEEIVREEKEYVEHERLFLGTRPWEHLDGLFAELAVAKLRELGW